MRTLVLSLALAFSLLTVRAQEGVKLTILHTNDFHSHLQGFGPESAYTPLVKDGDPTVGGFSRIAGIIDSVKRESEGETLVLDGGDCLMGTLFHAIEKETGFQLPLMKRAGYDVVAVGNHDFDFGPDTYAEIVRNSSLNGEIPVMLLGNGVTDPDNPGDDKFEEVMKEGLIRPYYIIEKSGLKIGLFSLLGKDADESAPYAPPVTFTKTTKAAKKLVRELRNQGCDIIICLSHSGVEKDKKGNWAGEDVKLAKKVKGIDMIISGHTHTLLEKPLMVNNVPVVQAGSVGRYVGKADIICSNGKLTLQDYTIIPVNDASPADSAIQAAIEQQKIRVNDVVLQPTGLGYDMPVDRSAFRLISDEYGDVASSNLGALVADAIYYYMNTQGPGTDIAMVAAGVIRDPVEPGTESVADLFRVMSLGSGNDAVPGYPLSKLWVTGRELKNIAEILIMSAATTPSHFCFWSHLRIEYDPEGGIFRKIKRLEFTDTDGNVTEVNTSKDDTRLYSIVANSYMLDFVGIIKKKSFGLINVVPKDKDGNPVTEMDNAVVDFDPVQEGIQEGKEWLALVSYLKHFAPAEGAAVPDLPELYNNPPRSLVQVNSGK